MATRKIEVNEDNLKRVILMLKLSKPYLSLPPKNLFLVNLWRIAPKLADKLMKKSGLVLVQGKGRMVLKPAGETSENAEEVQETGTLSGTEKIHHCRKRKSKV